MLKLYEIENELLTLDSMMDEYAATHEGELPEFLDDELDRLTGERQTKLLNIAAWIKSLRAEAKCYKEEKDRLCARQKACENKADKLASFVEFNIGKGETLKGVRAEIGWRKSSRVVVDTLLSNLPEEFVKIEKSARLNDLKAYIKSGGEIDGVWVEKIDNMQIR